MHGVVSVDSEVADLRGRSRHETPVYAIADAIEVSR
jgi:hypothetical protein